MLYQEEIQLILADLGITESQVARLWKEKPYLRKSRSGVTWGEHSGPNRGSGRMKVATERSYAEVISTIAHELRHEWQKLTGVLVWDGNRGKYGGWVWAGTEHAPAKSYSAKYKYWNRPHEIDARAYEADCFARLFQDKCDRPRQTISGAVLRVWDAAMENVWQ